MAVCEGEGFRPSLLATRAATVNRHEPRHRKLLRLLGWVLPQRTIGLIENRDRKEILWVERVVVIGISLIIQRTCENP